MSLLSDDDKALLVLEHLGPAALAGDTMSLYDCFQLALDVAEKAILAKLASAELPEPNYFQPQIFDKKKPYYTADQLRQAYAQGAASQLSAEPAGHFGFVESSQIWEEFHAPAGTPLFTLKEPK
jgi:hypothetical protein